MKLIMKTLPLLLFVFCTTPQEPSNTSSTNNSTSNNNSNSSTSNTSKEKTVYFSDINALSGIITRSQRVYFSTEDRPQTITFTLKIKEFENPDNHVFSAKFYVDEKSLGRYFFTDIAVGKAYWYNLGVPTPNNKDSYLIKIEISSTYVTDVIAKISYKTN